MSSRSPDLVKRMTDVVDEIIPTIPVDGRTSALITHIARCVLEAAEQQDNYMTLLAVASAESSAISRGPVGAAAEMHAMRGDIGCRRRIVLHQS